ncbi:MAG: alpha/beta hydrolase [Luminiphilus sp.]|nr:alpha/beta hydrolase [Luminiphilus sp.]
MKLNYSRLDPELLPILESFPALNISRDNILEIRALMAETPRPAPPSGLIQRVEEVATPEGPVTVHVYRKDERPMQPALLWIHGGGYVMGAADDERSMTIAHECDVTVFSVDYRLAPEQPFPAGLNDCYNVLSWIMQEADSLGIDPSCVAIGGASAGGGLAAGLALKNREAANYPLRLQLLIYPMLDNLHATDSGQIENHPIWTRDASFSAWEMYLNGTPGEAASPMAAPARASDVSGLPPAYLNVGVEDLFRDEVMAYARRLMAANVPTELALFPGMYHAGEVFTPTAAISDRLNRSFLHALSDALR